MKRIKNKYIIALFVLTAMLFTSLSAFAADTVYSDGYFYYLRKDESCIIVGYFGDEKEIQIPNMIAGYPVNTIATGAFTKCRAERICLPDTISDVQKDAFKSGVILVYNYNTKPLEVLYGIKEDIVTDKASDSESTDKVNEESTPSDSETETSALPEDTQTTLSENQESNPAESEKTPEDTTYTVPETKTPENEFLYSIKDSEIIITGYEGKSDVVVVPSEIAGKPVVSIAENALKDNGIKQVFLPSTIKSTEENAINSTAMIVMAYDSDTPHVFMQEGEIEGDEGEVELSEETITNYDETGITPWTFADDTGAVIPQTIKVRPNNSIVLLMSLSLAFLAVVVIVIIVIKKKNKKTGNEKDDSENQ